MSPAKECGHEWPWPTDPMTLHRCRLPGEHVERHRCPCGANP